MQVKVKWGFGVTYVRKNCYFRNKNNTIEDHGSKENNTNCNTYCKDEGHSNRFCCYRNRTRPDKRFQKEGVKDTTAYFVRSDDLILANWYLNLGPRERMLWNRNIFESINTIEAEKMVQVESQMTRKIKFVDI